MMKRIGLCIAALTLSSVASAGLIVDNVAQLVYVNPFGAHSYTHDVNDNGFVLGSAQSGTIEISIFDDGCTIFLCLDEALPEIIVITIEAFDFDTGGLVLGTSFSNSLGVQALAAVNLNGLLDVEVRSFAGDFYVGNSVLTLVTAEVPEPGTLSLLGLGLLGLGRLRQPIAPLERRRGRP